MPVTKVVVHDEAIPTKVQLPVNETQVTLELFDGNESLGFVIVDRRPDGKYNFKGVDATRPTTKATGRKTTASKAPARKTAAKKTSDYTVEA